MLRHEDYEELRWRAEAATFRGWYQSQRDSTSAAPDEVDQTYRLMRWSTRYLAELWKPIFEQRKVAMRISGVFCHKTPLAKFKDTGGNERTCELGDLLVVHDRLGREPCRRAALMQAKRTVRGTASASDDVQNELYRRFPPFSLSRKGFKKTRFKQGERNVGDVDSFARFALVADDAWMHPHRVYDRPPFIWPRHANWLRPAWTISHPKQDPVTSVGSETFGSFISGMLFDTHPARGRTVQPIPDLGSAVLGTGLDLDITVQELLDLTARRIAKSKHPWGGLPRGIVAFQDGTLPSPNPANPFSDILPPPREGMEPPEDTSVEDIEDEEGMSVILIETFSD
ncbi:hypothetical protein [Sphingomonas sp.]|uniref:hypothetical protein n=1 Tax=Sphingomonas sp. TaxID=28214 RepID=UPI000DBBF298|nr:hypothetical protein [Sphingomonas sp.]PZT93981.1 MAG: hypothetical protein DI625_07455 [Sphingomonas sp.]